MQAALILWSVATGMLVVAIGTGIYDTLSTRRRAKQMENVRPIDWSAHHNWAPFDDEIEIQKRITQEHDARVRSAQQAAMAQGRKTTQRTEPDNYRDEL